MGSRCQIPYWISVCIKNPTIPVILRHLAFDGWTISGNIRTIEILKVTGLATQNWIWAFN
jgi:hypothetical protein